MALNTRQSRVLEYLSEISRLLGNKTRGATFAAYFVGLMSSLQRKNAESIATLFSDEQTIQATHHRLVHLLNGSPWSDESGRRFAVNYALEALPEDEPVRFWIIDDTGFVKKGEHSVGVQRQYTGTSGKVDNCQIWGTRRRKEDDSDPNPGRSQGMPTANQELQETAGDAR